MRKYHFFYSLLLLLIVCNVQSQTLIINEVSNGPSGSQEYVELVVVDATATYDCSGSEPPCIDIRGWIIDDNSGYHGTSGIASGCSRFSNDPLWSCVPLGTIILVYNSADPNPDVPVFDDDMTDGNCLLSINLDNPQYFEFTTVTPGDVSCSYPSTGWGSDSSPDWSNIALANGGDCSRIVDLNGCEVFSLCYGTDNLNNQIYFSGNGQDDVWYFNDGDPSDQNNWSEGCAGDISACGSNEQTPGYPNNAANAAYISQFNNGCTPITPIITTAISTDAGCICDGTATASSSGSIPGYTYEWFTDNDVSIGITTASATGLCGGNYYVVGTSSIGCTDTALVTINSAATFTLSNSSTPPTCFNTCNGTATISVTGGTSPFSYNWNNSISTTNNANDLCDGPHTVTVTDGNNCVVSTSFNITEPTEIILTPTSNNSSCGLSNGEVSVSVSGGTIITDYYYLWDDPSSSTTPTVSNLSPGTYNVTVSDENGCSASTSASFIDIPAGTLSTAVDQQVRCNGNCDGQATVTVTGGTSPFSYLWDNGETTPSAVSLCAGPNSVQVTDNNGCIVSAPVTITEPDILSVSAIPSHPKCNGSTDGSITLIISGGTSPFSFLWSDNSTGQSLTNVGDGTYSITVTDAKGCTVSASSTLTAPSALTLSTSVTDETCGNSDGEICLTISGGTGPYSQTWDDPAIQSTICASNLTAGNYQAQVTDNQGCIQTASATVNNIGPIITTSIDSSNVSCNGYSDGFIQLTVNTPNSYTVSWTGTGGYSGIGDNISNLIAGIYNYTVNDASGCTFNGSVTLDEPTTTNLSLTGDSVTCSLLCDGSIMASGNGGTPPYQFSLDNNTWGTPIFSDLCPGPYTVYLMDAKGCTANQNLELFAKEFPADATITPVTSIICEDGSDLQLTAQDIGGTWSGTGITNAANGVFSPTTSGSGTFEVVYTISGACGDADTINIDVLALDIISIDPITPLCENSPNIILNATPSGGIWSGNGVSNGSTGEFSPSQTGSGSYTITYTSQGDCPNSGVTNIEVEAIQTPSISAPGTLCANGTSILLSADVIGGIWMVNGQPTSSVFDPSTYGAGTQEVVYSINAQCSKNDTIQVVISDIPLAEIQTGASGCAPLEVAIQNSIVDPGNSCVWSFGNGGTATICNSLSYTYYTPGCYDISVTVTNADGCSATYFAPDQICVTPQPIANFQFSPTSVTEFDPVVTLVNNSENAINYLWYISDTLFSIDENATYNLGGMPPQSYEFCLIAESEDRCRDSICQNIPLTEELSLYVPNSFTPDEDGINDYFQVISAGKSLSDYELMIFNRWGELIFETDDINTPWDGSHNGFPSPIDTYVWKIHYQVEGTSGSEELIGHVNLIK